MPKIRLITTDEAVPCSRQITKPCSDCPWSRDSLPGWLGSLAAEEWLEAAHGEVTIPCHALQGPECAGAAIYRANTYKLTRGDQLRLPANDRLVFATKTEFLDHHHHRSIGQDKL